MEVQAEQQGQRLPHDLLPIRRQQNDERRMLDGFCFVLWTWDMGTPYNGFSPSTRQPGDLAMMGKDQVAPPFHISWDLDAQRRMERQLDDWMIEMNEPDGMADHQRDAFYMHPEDTLQRPSS